MLNHVTAEDVKKKERKRAEFQEIFSQTTLDIPGMYNTLMSASWLYDFQPRLLV